MSIITDEQYTPEYWQARRGVPTASCADKLITPKTWKPSSGQEGYIHQLIADLYDPDYAEYEGVQTSAMKNGTQIEPEARAYFEFETGAEVREVGFILSDCGRYGCSPDGLVGDDAGLELKSPTYKTHVGYLIANEVPSDYLPQIHFSMVVTGLRKWYFQSYARHLPPLLKVVEWNAKTDELAKVMESFAKRYAEVLQLVKDMTPATEFLNKQEEEAALAVF